MPQEKELNYLKFTGFPNHQLKIYSEMFVFVITFHYFAAASPLGSVAQKIKIAKQDQKLTRFSHIVPQQDKQISTVTTKIKTETDVQPTNGKFMTLNGVILNMGQ